jgi:hypothetical protein|tara:strand:+ start:2682 stop:3434 length:753 start_codon:yes stop_codon:yes gene_type:complete
MIKLSYGGYLANQMMQYAVARILSNKTKYFLDGVPPIEGKFIDLNPPENNDIRYSNNEMMIGNDVWSIDYDSISKHKGLIHFYGYFQRYSNIKYHKEYVKNLYSFEKDKNLYDDNLIAVHIRLGEYCRHNNQLPKEYYVDCIRKSKKKAIIYTDQPTHPYVQEIESLVDCDISSSDKTWVEKKSPTQWDDFVKMASHKHIIISQSTYSWWAAWLSDATTIYYPLSYKNYWSHNGNDIDFTVDDEDRYIYV